MAETETYESTEGGSMPGLRVLCFAELKALKGIPFSRVHLNRLEKSGQFPRRVQLTPGTVVWIEAEIDAHVAARIAARDRSAA